MSAPEAELTIERLGARGDGVADWDGDRVFVPYTVPGDRVRVRIRAEGKDRLVGRVREVLAPGPGRGTPDCPHFGVCGGCALQHLDAVAYGAWKRDLVIQTLDRAGLNLGTDPSSDWAADVVGPLAVSPPGSRRRADFTAIRRQQDVLLGFNERGSHRVVDIGDCPVLRPDIVALMPALRAFFERQFRPGDTAEVRVQATDSGLDLLLVTPASLGAGGRQGLAELAAAADLARVSRGHPRQTGTEPVVERRPVRAVFGGVPVALPPGAFLQATAEGEAALSQVVLAAAEGARLVADLYAGAGTFALPLAAAGAKVFAADVSRDAMENLRRAAQSARLPVRTEARNLARNPVPADRLAGGDVIVFDPPRAGAKAQAVEIAASRVPVVVAVSCNPATFARDAQALADGGYVLERVTPVDQFLWSPHLELAAVFRHGG